MLPDFPAVRNEMDDVLTRFLRARVMHHEGIVSEIAQHTIHEGSRNSIIRPDGKEDETEMVQLEEEMKLKWKDLATLDLAGAAAQLDKVAAGIAAQKSKHFFETLGQAAEKVGNVVDGKGRPLSPDVILEVLSTIQIDFDELGNPSNLNIVIPPSQQERAADIAKQFTEDNSLRRRYDRVIEQKKEEWRAREATRILVG